ncbi:MAG: hypothetical protein VCF24_09160 [Candidatus Latescibacterota bacterium]
MRRGGLVLRGALQLGSQAFDREIAGLEVVAQRLQTIGILVKIDSIQVAGSSAAGDLFRRGSGFLDFVFPCLEVGTQLPHLVGLVGRAVRRVEFIL